MEARGGGEGRGGEGRSGRVRERGNEEIEAESELLSCRTVW